MSIVIVKLLSKFECNDDRESDTALFRTNVPWLGPLAYLNIVFKPVPPDILSEAEQRLSMPQAVVEFLKEQNGIILFSDAINVCGVHRPGQLLNREEPFLDLPYDIENENDNWPPYDPERFLAIGGYGFDGSTACIDRRDSRIYLFRRGEGSLLPAPLMSWPSLEEWLIDEIARLSMLFDRRGRRLVPESQTVPHPQHLA